MKGRADRAGEFGECFSFPRVAIFKNDHKCVGLTQQICSFSVLEAEVKSQSISMIESVMQVQRVGDSNACESAWATIENSTD